MSLISLNFYNIFFGLFDSEIFTKNNFWIIFVSRNGFCRL
ncbi:hypothetical protein LEP1GSC034_0055 [Leptospira interrogans str. 2003000735]|nr:hypothetical protein LEP1GSC027_1458 [Leptospira interrogans str. 2002000624]EKQ36378.1 hypothetical protein LEP1GSC025_3250 [Leptospira interrogans str. 2002000621]EKQ45817.1 hypothetical protein LEP1GSC026_1592 [Leptospira interrogans str. 2002000623]EMJ66631.1 hypothetical protein LEP1GSC034_0055 [Leptospira interrogans str. 2003000735]EMJ72098.1 hypothetical protein LEP1GSC033_0374 [Leptospira interrogans str. 2002000632]EMJ82302.1 hypothetical protein LEP1GSC032_3820 [Leptospira interr